jgi:hypothetical protein
MVPQCVLKYTSEVPRARWTWQFPIMQLRMSALTCSINSWQSTYITMLPTFGASSLFVKTLLSQLMEAGLASEAPLCTLDPETQILTTPRDAVQDGVLSDVCFLPFFQDILAEKLAADATKKGRRRSILHPKCVFNLAALAVSRLCMVQMMEKILL